MSPAKMTPVQQYAYRVYRTLVKSVGRPEGEAMEICQQRASRVAHAHSQGENPVHFAWTLYNTWAQDHKQSR